MRTRYVPPPSKVECWGRWEVRLMGSDAFANPFTEGYLSALFLGPGGELPVTGYYDGDNEWVIRFSPNAVGEWSWFTASNDPVLDGKRGSVRCVPATEDNHGPLRVRNQHHFAYADGTGYYPVGTTLYNWMHRDERLRRQTLATLKASPFNKIRCCLLPKWYAYNKVEPELFPWPRKGAGFDHDRYNPAYFAAIEGHLDALLELGIQCDLILLHPYDNPNWGHSTMTQAQDEALLRYTCARLAVWRNVWWTMANEYDLFNQHKDWDHLMQIVRQADPYDRFRANHNCRTWYDHSRPWVSHCNIQHQRGQNLHETALIARYRYHKPVLVDEYGYEGDIPEGWGNLPPQQEVLRHWSVAMAGGYASHGETYLNSAQELWWSVGGELKGQSPARLGFLREIMSAAPYELMSPEPHLLPGKWVLAQRGRYYLIFFPKAETDRWQQRVRFELPGMSDYTIEGIDPWEMTVEALGETAPGRFERVVEQGPYLLRLIAKE